MNVERVETIIQDWLGKEFGNRDALPGLVLKGLAEEIFNHRDEFHDAVKAEYLIDDIKSIAESEETELTKEEIERAVSRYYKIEDSYWDDLTSVVLDIISDRESQSSPLSMAEAKLNK